jgi:hypothetical protein
MRNPLRPSPAEQTIPAAALREHFSSRETPASVRVHGLNILFIIGALVILFWRVFFQGQTLIDVSTLNNQLPWGYYAGESSDYAYDRRDPTDMYLTRDYFVVQAYNDGELPLWNPYTMSGHPIYADGVTRILSPSLVFYKFLDLPHGYTVARIVELGLGSIFLYIFLAGTGVRAPSALMGALVFAFSSHSMLHLIGLGWWGGLMWLPLILLFVDRALRSKSFAWASMAGIALGIQIYSGYLANEIYYLGAIVLYYSFFGLRGGPCSSGSAGRSWTGESGRHPAPLGAFSMMALTLVAGLSISAPAWVPVLEQLKYSNRLIVPTQISYIYLPPWYLITLVFPNILGAPYDARFLTLFQAINVSHDHSLYMGIAPLAMFGFCLFWLMRVARPAKRLLIQTSAMPAEALAVGDQFQLVPSFGRDRLIFFTGLFGLALLIITAAPVYVHVTKFVPVLQTIRVIMRGAVLLVFSASVLVAFGCQLLLDAPRDAVMAYYRVGKRSLYFLIGALAIGAAGAYAIKAAGWQASSQSKGKLAFIKNALSLIATQLAPPNIGVFAPLGLILAVCILLYLAATRRINRQAVYSVMVGLLIVDLFWNSRNFEHSYDGSAIYPHTQTTDRLAQLPPGRVLPTPSDIEMNRRVDAMADRPKIIAPPNTLLPYRVPTVTGKDQIFPKWYRDFAALVETQPNMSHIVFDRSQSPFLDLINTRYILTRAAASPPTGAELIQTSEGLTLYRNPAALPRAFFAANVRTVRDQAEALSTMREPGFDPATTVVVEDPGSAGMDGMASDGASGKASLIEDRRNSVQLITESETGGILFLSDTYYPGWTATVDSIPARIFKADVAFRAVQVPAGRHVVRFVFAPCSFRLSFYAGAAGALIAGAGLLFGVIRKKSPVVAINRVQDLE